MKIKTLLITFLLMISCATKSEQVSPSDLYGSWICIIEEEDKGYVLTICDDGIYAFDIVIGSKISYEEEGTWSYTDRLLLLKDSAVFSDYSDKRLHFKDAEKKVLIIDKLGTFIKNED